MEEIVIIRRILGKISNKGRNYRSNWVLLRIYWNRLISKLNSSIKNIKMRKINQIKTNNFIYFLNKITKQKKSNASKSKKIFNKKLFLFNL